MLMRSSQNIREKGFKNKTKKLEKKLKAVEERETNLKLANINLEPTQKKVDSNGNEAAPKITEMESVEASAVILPSVPVKNSYDTLSKLGEDITAEHFDLVEKGEQPSREFEIKVRMKIRSSIKKKV